jgi:hypothetical protein
MRLPFIFILLDRLMDTLIFRLFSVLQLNMQTGYVLVESSLIRKKKKEVATSDVCINI